MHGYHATTCAKWGDRVAKHTCLCKEAAHTGHRAFLHPRCERNVGPVGTTNRDADVLLRVWEGGKPLAMDFAGTHPQQPSNCTHAGMNPPGSWATEYARLHKSAGRARCAATGTPFAAMVVETFGTWSPEAFGILSKMAGFLARHTGIETHVAAKRLFSRMSCILQRCNVRSILARSCPHRPHDDDPLFAEDWPCPVADVVVEDPELAQDGTAQPRTHTVMREGSGEDRNWDEEGSYTLEDAGVDGEMMDGGGGGMTTESGAADRTTLRFPGSGRPLQPAADKVAAGKAAADKAAADKAATDKAAADKAAADKVAADKAAGDNDADKAAADKAAADKAAADKAAADEATADRAAADKAAADKAAADEATTDRAAADKAAADKATAEKAVADKAAAGKAAADNAAADKAAADKAAADKAAADKAAADKAAADKAAAGKVAADNAAADKAVTHLKTFKFFYFLFLFFSFISETYAADPSCDGRQGRTSTTPGEIRAGSTKYFHFCPVVGGKWTPKNPALAFKSSQKGQPREEWGRMRKIRKFWRWERNI